MTTVSYRKHLFLAIGSLLTWSSRLEVSLASPSALRQQSQRGETHGQGLEAARYMLRSTAVQLEEGQESAESQENWGQLPQGEFQPGHLFESVLQNNGDQHRRRQKFKPTDTPLPSSSPASVTPTSPTSVPSTISPVTPSPIGDSVIITVGPTNSPTPFPLASPTVSPTNNAPFGPPSFPSTNPTAAPTNPPTNAPSGPPSYPSTNAPTATPTNHVTNAPTTALPTQYPTTAPTNPNPTTQTPTTSTPTAEPSTFQPTRTPSLSPTSPAPTTIAPTETLSTWAPTWEPTALPVAEPTITPTATQVTAEPTPAPSAATETPTITDTSSTPTFTLAPSIAPTNEPSLSPSSIGPSISATPSQLMELPDPPVPVESAVPTLDPLGFDEAQAETGDEALIQTCRRPGPSGYPSQLFAISYTYNMLLAPGADIEAAVLEGEKLMGQGVADIMCREEPSAGESRNLQSESSSAYLKSINSLMPDTYLENGCQSLADGMDCHRVNGVFTAQLYVEAADISFAEIDAKMQPIITDVVPTVISELVEFQPTTAAKDTTDGGGSGLAADESDAETTDMMVPITGAIVGGAAALVIVSAVFFLRSRRGANRDDDEVGDNRTRQRQAKNGTTGADQSVQPPTVVAELVRDGYDPNNDEYSEIGSHNYHQRPGRRFRTGNSGLSVSGDSYISGVYGTSESVIHRTIAEVGSVSGRGTISDTDSLEWLGVELIADDDFTFASSTVQPGSSASTAKQGNREYDRITGAETVDDITRQACEGNLLRGWDSESQAPE